MICALCFGFLGQIYEFRKKVKATESKLLSKGDVLAETAEHTIYLPTYESSTPMKKKRKKQHPIYETAGVFVNEPTYDEDEYGDALIYKERHDGDNDGDHKETFSLSDAEVWATSKVVSSEKDKTFSDDDDDDEYESDDDRMDDDKKNPIDDDQKDDEEEIDDETFPCYLCGLRFSGLKLQYHINEHESKFADREREGAVIFYFKLYFSFYFAQKSNHFHAIKKGVAPPFHHRIDYKSI